MKVGPFRRRVGKISSLSSLGIFSVVVSLLVSASTANPAAQSKTSRTGGGGGTVSTAAQAATGGDSGHHTHAIATGPGHGPDHQHGDSSPDDCELPPENYTISEYIEFERCVVNLVLYDLEELVASPSTETLSVEVLNATLVLVSFLQYQLEDRQGLCDADLRDRLVAVIVEALNLAKTVESTSEIQEHAAIALQQINLSLPFPGSTYTVFQSNTSNGTTDDDNTFRMSTLNKTAVGVRAVLQADPAAAIILPKAITQHACAGMTNSKRDRNVTIRYMAFPNGAIFCTSYFNDSADSLFSVISPVIGSTLGNLTVRNLAEPVTIVLRPNKVVNQSQYAVVCVWWDSRVNGSGGWSTTGMWLDKTLSTSNQFVCRSTHLTSFALLQIKRGEKCLDIEADEYRVVSLIELYGGAVSFVCMLATLVILLSIAELRKDTSHKVFIHYCLVLCILSATSVLYNVLTPTDLSCTAVGVTNHYLILVLFAWSLVQAIDLYRQLVKVFDREVNGFVWKMAFLCYGIPALVVFSTSAGSGFRDLMYIRDLRRGSLICTLTLGYATVFSLYVPIGTVITINLGIFICIMAVAIRKRLNSPANVSTSKTRNRLQFFRVFFATFTLLGLTWLLGFIAQAIGDFALDVIFTTLLALTGFFIFITKVVLSQPVQMAVCKRISLLVQRHWSSLPGSSMASSSKRTTKEFISSRRSSDARPPNIPGMVANDQCGTNYRPSLNDYSLLDLNRSMSPATSLSLSPTDLHDSQPFPSPNFQPLSVIRTDLASSE